MQKNDISEIINMEKQDTSPVVYHMLQNSQPTSASVKSKNIDVENTVGQGQKL